MSHTIQHLRANREGWALHDIIPADGELALLQIGDGGTLIKIGDGERPFSELASLTGEVVRGSSDQLLLRHGEEARYDVLSSLTLSFPYVIREDYYAALSFDSPQNTPTALSYPEAPKIYFSGDDVSEGIFVPDVKKHYSLFFWYDGRMQGLVRGVTVEAL